MWRNMGAKRRDIDNSYKKEISEPNKKKSHPSGMCFEQDVVDMGESDFFVFTFQFEPFKIFSWHSVAEIKWKRW